MIIMILVKIISKKEESKFTIITTFIISFLAFAYYSFYYPEQKIKSLKADAEHGHSFAQYELAMMYIERGEGLDNNLNAAKWLIEAASNGHEKAKIMLCCV